jgi:geranylgeranyl pyrophosphate synthase
MNGAAVPPPVTAVIDTAGAWMPARLGEVERRLAEIAASHGPRLGEEAGATLSAGGKRLRPLLVLIAAGSEAGDRAVRAAVAVELVHMATLVHDDVLDGAPVRRGRPTVVARAGRERAVGVGDLLFSRAFAELAIGGGPEVAELSSASVALAKGELAQRRDAYDTSVSEERYLERCALKTARLFEAACTVGRLASGAAGTERLAEYGRQIGLAFQLLDDVLDVTGPPERTGKARGTDLLDGTVTLPLIWARQEDPGLESIDLHGIDAAGAEAICDRIAATGSLERVRGLARERVTAAKAVLETGDFADSERHLLGLIADGVVERYS